MGKLSVDDPIFSEDFNEKIGFVTPMASLWYFKMNLPSCIFIGAICISFLFLTDWIFSMFLGIEFQSSLFLASGMWWIYVVVFLMGLGIGFKIDKKIYYRHRKFNQDGDTEVLGDVTITHRFITAKNITWHYVETGPSDGEVIIFMHGVPESWYCWHHQIRDFSKDYHIYAFDLKGYGQSDKKLGDYRWEAVMEEFVAVLDKLGLEKFNYVAHDRGAVIGDYLGGTHPERMIRFVRGQQVLAKWNPVRSPQEQMWIRPIVGTLANGFPRVIIPGAYARWYS